MIHLKFPLFITDTISSLKIFFELNLKVTERHYFFQTSFNNLGSYIFTFSYNETYTTSSVCALM